MFFVSSKFYISYSSMPYIFSPGLICFKSRPPFTVYTSIGVEFVDFLSYRLTPRSSNRADSERGGMQVR